MIKDEISDNNNQCENVESITEEKVRDDCIECVSEDGLCDVGGGMDFKDKLKTNLVVAYGAPNKFPKIPIVKYGSPKIFENKESNDSSDIQPKKEK